MAKVTIPPNIGKVKVAMTLGNKWTVWNGKQGQHEFVIILNDRKQAEEVARQINSKEHDGEITFDATPKNRG
ncbi:hypothetical protein [Humisphaera borealis]|uniref:Uncharacterized protein n=1 Tax=Humisphaera borealis TaxID=2807512 RepID=A0A7M2WSE3_9BACT|nr:hypothetical protein [Humisphaera borealis]QOV88102.1 hypothetical protein IPV69_17790 [Humisphaera borealis]